jgi:hypothetical protein
MKTSLYLVSKVNPREDVEYCRCDVTQMQLFFIDVIITGAVVMT